MPEVIASDVRFPDVPGAKSDDLPAQDLDTDTDVDDLDIPSQPHGTASGPTRSPGAVATPRHHSPDHGARGYI